jgi:hypothetical protein
VIDTGTLWWYTRAKYGGNKLLILLALWALTDNPPLGTIQLLSLCFKSK